MRSYYVLVLNSCNHYILKLSKVITVWRFTSGHCHKHKEYGAFHLGLHFLLKHPSRGFPNTKGKRKCSFIGDNLRLSHGVLNIT